MGARSSDTIVLVLACGMAGSRDAHVAHMDLGCLGRGLGGVEGKKIQGWLGYESQGP